MKDLNTRNGAKGSRDLQTGVLRDRLLAAGHLELASMKPRNGSGKRINRSDRELVASERRMNATANPPESIPE
ncbi:hypothetical protein E3N88_43992 [Mikania micrantha]|uniref:Uncharacterized protein n=1 Tax=Mikania micrantha TaxID=192012 RepID=A0A5N6LDI2_9ASTR|nr:hypothetical protein E3N88_43991 [Mikania micrantha]KAD0605068.1 hypothetical protein E3N88_43992 [Mikania micrantha]